MNSETKSAMTGRYTVHMCQSISGAIRNWSRDDWKYAASGSQWNGEKFRIWDFEGKKVIPIGPECKGFSYEKGCPGHPVDE